MEFDLSGGVVEHQVDYVSITYVPGIAEIDLSDV
jgi:hypothetical protein